MDVIDPVAGKLSIFPEPGVLFPWAEWVLPTISSLVRPIYVLIFYEEIRWKWSFFSLREHLKRWF